MQEIELIVFRYFGDSYSVFASYAAANLLGVILFIKQVRRPESYAIAGLAGVVGILALGGIALASWGVSLALEGYHDTNPLATRFAMGHVTALSSILLWCGAAALWSAANLALHTFQGIGHPSRHWSIVALVGTLLAITSGLSGFAFGAIQMLRERAAQPNLNFTDIYQTGLIVGWVFFASGIIVTVAFVAVVALVRHSQHRHQPGPASIN